MLLTTLTSEFDVFSSSFAHHSSGASTANMEQNYFIKHYGMDYFGEAKSPAVGLLGLTHCCRRRTLKLSRLDRRIQPLQLFIPV